MTDSSNALYLTVFAFLGAQADGRSAVSGAHCCWAGVVDGGVLQQPACLPGRADLGGQPDAAAACVAGSIGQYDAPPPVGEGESSKLALDSSKFTRAKVAPCR